MVFRNLPLHKLLFIGRSRTGNQVVLDLVPVQVPGSISISSARSTICTRYGYGTVWYGSRF